MNETIFKKLRIIVFCLPLINCSFGKVEKVTMIKVTPQYEPYKVLDISSQRVLLIGTDKTGNDNSSTKSKILIRERGLFNVHKTSLDGECMNFYQSRDYLYLINKIYSEKFSISKGSTKLFKLNKTTLDSEFLFDFKNSFVKSIYFEDNQSDGYAFVRTSNLANDYSLFTTNNGGKNWDSLEIGKPILKTLMSNGKLFFLSKRQDGQLGQIYSIDKSNLEIDSTYFDFDIEDFSIQDEKMYLLGEKDGSTVLRKVEDGIITDIHTFRQSTPKKIYCYNNFIAVDIFSIDVKTLGGFGGNRHQLQVSYDNGNNWVNRSFEDAQYYKPLSFYKDEIMMAYIGRGNLIKYR